MKALTFDLQLLEPLLATGLGGGDPNSAVGFEFIPGSAIRGMVISRYASLNPVDAGNTDFRRLFLDGRVRFLNAYPLVQGRRALPTPLSWHLEKDKDNTIYDFTLEDAGSEAQWQRAKQPFCDVWQNEAGICRAEMLSPDRNISIHTARENRQKPTKGKSEVFRYDALAPEQTFYGVILAGEDDLQILKPLLPEGILVGLGGSHLAGYGKTRLKHVKIQDDWQEYAQVGEEIDSIIVTLLSDTLIRDPLSGSYSGNLYPLLGRGHERAFTSIRSVGGFNRKWNLPLPQTQAIRAGSVFVYPADPSLLARLQTLIDTGIGERRSEGFGRFAINWHKAAEIKPLYRSKPTQPLPFILTDEISKNQARQMAKRMLREKLDQKLISVVNNKKIRRPPNTPSNSQLSRMRIIARRALLQNNPAIIIQHLDGMKKAARDQFQHAWIGDVRLDNWLRERAENVNNIWQIIKVDRTPSIGGAEADLNSLSLDYTVALIEHVLRQAQKEATK
ncbi:MAG: hypothetical protein M0Q13_08795 [Methanothrix sp.]|jgi:CRISPR-associated protein Csx10|nr:hypothetical protein [Methanothrix sp.]